MDTDSRWVTHRIPFNLILSARRGSSCGYIKHKLAERASWTSAHIRAYMRKDVSGRRTVRTISDQCTGIEKGEVLTLVYLTRSLEVCRERMFPRIMCSAEPTMLYLL